jgi:hypothetical protein
VLERLLTKLGDADDPDVQALVASLVRNLCVRPPFARALNQPLLETAKKLARLRDAYDLHAWRRNASGNGNGNGSNGGGNGGGEGSGEELSSGSPQRAASTSKLSELNVSRSVNFTTNVLLGFKTNELREAAAVATLKSQPPIHAEVTWDTWGSKLDRMWNPVLTIAPVAQVASSTALVVHLKREKERPFWRHGFAPFLLETELKNANSQLSAFHLLNYTSHNLKAVHSRFI